MKFLVLCLKLSFKLTNECLFLKTVLDLSPGCQFESLNALVVFQVSPQKFKCASLTLDCHLVALELVSAFNLRPLSTYGATRALENPPFAVSAKVTL